jgi:hypothetical protein
VAVSRIERWTRQVLETEARKRGVPKPENHSRPELIALILRHDYGSVRRLRSARTLLGSLIGSAAGALPALTRQRSPLAAARTEHDPHARSDTAGAPAPRQVGGEPDAPRPFAERMAPTHTRAPFAEHEAMTHSAAPIAEHGAQTHSAVPSAERGAPIDTPAPVTERTAPSSRAATLNPAAAVFRAPVADPLPAGEEASRDSPPLAAGASTADAALPPSAPSMLQPTAAQRSPRTAADSKPATPDDAQLEQRRELRELHLRWQVSEPAAARARALLGVPGELAVRLVTVRADPGRVVQSEVMEHGPIAQQGEWTAQLVSADTHCVSAIGLRSGGRFVSIVHKSSRP